MKRFTLIVSLILFALLLIAAVPVTATTTTVSSDSISDVYPKVAYADGKSVTYTITGTNFSTAEGDVYLEMDDENDITAYSISSWTYNKIVCKFKITSTKKKGKWNLVIKNTYVNQTAGTTANTYVVRQKAITVVTPITLTSISPSTGSSGDDDVDFTLVGTGFENDENEVEDVFLFNDEYDDNATADFDIDSSTKIKGSFNLENAEDDKYDVCVKDSFGTDFCDLDYTVNNDEYGSIEIKSSPTGATILLDSVSKGTTPLTIDDVITGSHRITIQKSGYQEFTKVVTVTKDDTTEVSATLNTAATATPVQTTNPTAAATSRPTTARTTAKSTIKVPTTWADTPAPTTASPVDPVLIIGTAGLAFIALRKH